MFHRLALTSGLIVINFVVSNAVAVAEVTFSNLTSGNLQAVGGNMKVLESATPATLTVSVPLDRVAKITVLPPSLLSGASADPNGTTRVGFVNFNSTSLRSDEGNASASLPPGQTNLEFRLGVERPVAFTAGTYNYALNLNVTITPP